MLSLFLAGRGNAQIDYDNPTISVAVSGGQIQSASGLSGTSLRAIALDSSGRLVFFDGGLTGVADGFLFRADVSGATPVFTTRATESQLLSGTGSDSGATTSLDVISVVVHPTNGSIYLGQSRQADDIISVANPGATPTVTNIREGDGVVGMTLNSAGTDIVFTLDGGFGAVNEDLVKVAVAGGAPSVIANEAAIVAASGGSDAALGAPARHSSGDFLFWDEEAASQGSDKILRATESGTVSVMVGPSGFPGGIGGGVSALAIDGNDTLFMWNEFPAGDLTRASAELTIREASGALHSIPIATIKTALGMADFDVSNGGLVAKAISASQVELFAAETTQDQIVKFAFADPRSGVRDWVFVE